MSESERNCIIQTHDGLGLSSSSMVEMLWRLELHTLYRDFCQEDGREPPETIVVFDAGRIIRFLVGNEKPTNDDLKGFGMATLVLHRDGTGTRLIGHVEDVFIRPEHRGQGYSERLMRRLIEEARARKLIRLELTSNPKRIAANLLYQKLGFRLVAQATLETTGATNLYRLTF